MFYYIVGGRHKKRQMGTAWSTSAKGLKNFNVLSPCYEGDVDYNSSIYADSHWKGLKSVYLPIIVDDHTDYRLVKIPKSATVGEFCNIASNSFGGVVDYTESVLFWTCILLSFLVLFVRGYPAKIGLLVALALIVYRILPPRETISWADASVLRSSLLSDATKFSKTVDTFIAPPSTGSDVPGTTTAAHTDTSEVVRMNSGVVLPLHAHTKFTYAVAITEGMEYTTGQSWTVWKKGSILGVPPGLNHTVRASTSAMFVSFHPTGALKDI